MRFRILLAALLGLILALPLESERVASMLALFGGIIPLSGGSLGGRKLSGLAILTVLLSLHELANLHTVPGWVSMAVLAVYFWLTASLVLRQVFHHTLSTPEMLCGALSCYLLLGLGWTGAFGLLEHLQPGSLQAPQNPIDSCSLLYFTFITLLTIGYGDVLPATAPARLMTVLTGLSGMVFTTVVLASLVTLQMAKHKEISE